MYSRDEIKALTDKVLNMAKADAVEVSFDGGERSATRWANSSITVNLVQYDQQITVNVRHGQKQGTATTRELDDEGLKTAVDEANDAAQKARDNPNLPALVKGFDVCLMPFAMNAATRYINPTKTLEYMAAGKPIVSSAVPDVVHNFTPIVAVAHSHDEFVDAVASALQRPDPVRIEEGIARAESAGWEAIVASMRNHIVHTLARS